MVHSLPPPVLSVMQTSSILGGLHEGMTTEGEQLRGWLVRAHMFGRLKVGEESPRALKGCAEGMQVIVAGRLPFCTVKYHTGEDMTYSKAF